MKKLLIMILGGLCLLPGLTAQPLENLPDDPRIVKGTLANGLSYYLVKNQALPGRADFYLVEKSGSALEGPGQAGMSAFLAQMSIRGTRSFPGTTMLDYFEGLGLDVNRDFEIRTALEETIFRLSNVPVAKSAAVMDSTLLVLYNWSCSMNLDEEDVRQEKAFFRNEYITRDSAQHRISRQLRIQLLKGTQYEHTFTKDLLAQMEAFSSKELRQFYYRWSRPDLQALVLVGDIDPAQVEMKIKALFQTMPKAPVVEERDYEQPRMSGSLEVVHASDPQASQAELAFHFRSLPLPENLRNTTMAYLQTYVEGMAGQLLEERMQGAKSSSGLPIWNENVTHGRFLGIQNQESLRLSFATLPDSLDKAVLWTARLLEQIRRQGFSHEEFVRAKTRYAANLEHRYQYRDFTPNQTYAARCISHFLGGTTLASVEMDHALLQLADSLLSFDAFNTYVSAMLRSPEDLTVALTGPEGVTYPDQQWVERALEVISELSTGLEVAVPLGSVNLPAVPLLLENPPVVTIQTEEPMSGATLITLSNGVTVLLKSTQAQPGEFVFSAVSKGGLSLLRETSPLQRDYMTRIANLTSVAGVPALDLSIYNRARGIELSKTITYSLSSLEGGAPVGELETFLQQVYHHFTGIQEDPQAFDYFVQVEQAKEQYARRNPHRMVDDSLMTYLYNASRYTALSDPADLSQMNYSGAVQFLSKLYENAANYTFLFVGDFDTEAIKPLVVNYLGLLPGNPNRRDNWQTLPFYLNKSVRSVHLPMSMSDSKAYYRIALMGESPYGLEEMVTGNLIEALMNAKIRQTLFLSGVVPTVQAEFRKYPEEFLLIEAGFESESYDPALVQELNRLFDDLQQNGIDEALLANLKLGLKNRFELRKETTCDFWRDLLVSRFVYGKDFYSRYLSCLEDMKLEDFNQALARYLGEGGRLDLVLYGNNDHSN